MTWSKLFLQTKCSRIKFKNVLSIYDNLIQFLQEKKRDFLKYCIGFTDKELVFF